MKQFGFVLMAMLMAGAARAATYSSAAAGGDWYSSETWGGSGCPQSGDTVNITAGSTVTISAGEVVTNVAIFIFREGERAATLSLQSGASITNGRITVGHMGTGRTAVDTAIALLEVDDGARIIKDANDNSQFEIKDFGELRQLGGTISAKSITVSGLGFFDQRAGVATFTTSLTASSAADPRTGKVCYRLGKSAELVTPAVYGQAGVVELLGESHPDTTKFYAGNVNYADGCVAFRDFTNTIANVSAAYASATRLAPSGTVAFVDSAVTLTSANLSGSTYAGAHVGLRADNSQVRFVNDLITLSSSDPAEDGRTAQVSISNSADVAIMASTYPRDAFADSDDDFIGYYRNVKPPPVSVNARFYGKTAVSVVGKSRLRVLDRIFLGCGASLEVADAGRVICNRLVDDNNANGGASPYVTKVRVRDGGLLRSYGDFCLGYKYAGLDFEMSGGSIYPGGRIVQIGNANGANVAKFTISGGTVSNTPILNIMESGMAELRFVGAEWSGDFSAITTNWPGSAACHGDSALIEYVLTRKAPHIRCVDLKNNYLNTRYEAKRIGDLRVRLDGGVLMTAAESFDLLSSAKTFSPAEDYRSKPDASLWTVTTSADSKTSGVALADATFAVANWEMDEHILAEPLPMGSFALDGVRTRSLKEYHIGLALRAADGGTIAAEKLEELKDGLVVAGYTNSVCDAAAAYNLTVAVPADGVSAGAQRFVWDFTETKSIRTVDSVTTNALVSAVKVFANTLNPGLIIILK